MSSHKTPISSPMLQYVQVRRHIKDPQYVNRLMDVEHKLEQNQNDPRQTQHNYMALMNVASQAVDKDPSISPQDRSFLRQQLNDIDIRNALRELKLAKHKMIQYIKQLRRVYKKHQVRKSMEIMHDMTLYLAQLCQTVRRYRRYNLQFTRAKSTHLQRRIRVLTKLILHIYDFMQDHLKDFPSSTDTDVRFLMDHLQKAHACLRGWSNSTGYAELDTSRSRKKSWWRWFF